MFKIKFELEFELKKVNTADQRKFEKATQIIDEVPALIKKFAAHRGDQCEVYGNGQLWMTVTKISNKSPDYQIELADCKVSMHDFLAVSSAISTIERGLESHKE